MLRRLAPLAILTTLGGVLLVATPASATGIISSLSVSPDAVRGGASSVGSVLLAFPDPDPTVALLFSANPSAAAVPSTVTIPAGALQASFTITTNASAAPDFVTITAAISNVPRTAILSVNAATPAGPSLSAVSTNPSTVTGGSPTTGTVTFSGVTDGAIVQLASNTAGVVVPPEIVVNGGAASAAFPVTTPSVTTTKVATITASWFGVPRTTSVTVVPGAPAAADKVVIKRMTWVRGLLRVEATSTNPKAILSAYQADSNSFMFTLNNNGGGNYSYQA